MELIKYYSEDKISEVAYRLSDIDFQDFSKVEVGEAIYWAENNIARTYNLLERVAKIEISDEDVISIPLNIKRILKVSLDNKVLSKTINDKLAEDEYRLVVVDGEYTIVLNEKKSGVLQLYYIASAINEYEYSGQAILPQSYHEEIINKAVIRLCEVGIGRFSQEKNKKYYNLYLIYSRKDGYKSELARDDEWIQIKPFRF